MLGGIGTTHSRVSGSLVVAPLTPLWEWCLWAGISPEASHSLPDSRWGLYSPSENEAIERAITSGLRRIELVMGVR
eukprot:10804474-Heterocapsa_arctica.AAC.1